MKFSFRKIASVIASVVMLGSTAGTALAASYPAPFVVGGAADAAVVVTSGTHTGSVSDYDAAVSLQSALQALVTTTATGATAAGGDSVKLEKSSDKLNLRDTMNGTFGSTVDDEDLPTLLADGVYTNDENTEYKFEQKITLQGLQLTHFADSDYKDKEPTIGFRITSNTVVLNYTLDFTTDAESDVDSGLDLSDFETTDLNILGKNYYILDAENGTLANSFGKVTLLDSASSSIVTEGETATVVVSGVSYEVSIEYVGSSDCRLTVNGETTNSLAEGGTYKLSDGTYVGIKDIMYVSKDTGVSRIEFSVGKGKLEIEAGQEVELNDDDVDGMKGWFIRGTASASKQKLDKIVIQWIADEEVFIAPDGELEMPGFGAVKFSMGNFVRPADELLKVDYDGDDSIEIIAPIKDGTARFNILQANATGDFVLLGKDTDERLATTTGSKINFTEKAASDNYHRWFVATYNTTKDGESYLLSASITESDNRNRTSIKNEVTGSTVCSEKIAGDSCDIGDVTLTITTVFKNATDEYVTLTGGSNVHFNVLFTAGGLKVFLPYEGAITDTGYGAINLTNGSGAGHNADSFYVFFKEENKDDDKGAGTMFNATINDDSDNDLHVSAVDTGQSNLEIKGTDDDTVSYVYSDLATQVKKIVVNDKGRAEITYPSEQAYAEVFLSAPSVSVTQVGGTVLVVRDNEVDSVKGNNLVVVGGSCVNAAARMIVDPTATAPVCGEDFTAKTNVGAGQYLVQAVASPYNAAKTAVLVAGYDAADTKNAVTKLKEGHPTDVGTSNIYPVTSA